MPQHRLCFCAIMTEQWAGPTPSWVAKEELIMLNGGGSAPLSRAASALTGRKAPSLRWTENIENAERALLQQRKRQPRQLQGAEEEKQERKKEGGESRQDSDMISSSETATGAAESSDLIVDSGHERRGAVVVTGSEVRKGKMASNFETAQKLALYRPLDIPLRHSRPTSTTHGNEIACSSAMKDGEECSMLSDSTQVLPQQHHSSSSSSLGGGLKQRGIHENQPHDNSRNDDESDDDIHVLRNRLRAPLSHASFIASCFGTTRSSKTIVVNGRPVTTIDVSSRSALPPSPSASYPSVVARSPALKKEQSRVTVVKIPVRRREREDTFSRKSSPLSTNTSSLKRVRKVKQDEWRSDGDSSATKTSKKARLKGRDHHERKHHRHHSSHRACSRKKHRSHSIASRTNTTTTKQQTALHDRNVKAKSRMRRKREVNDTSDSNSSTFEDDLPPPFFTTAEDTPSAKAESVTPSIDYTPISVRLPSMCVPLQLPTGCDGQGEDNNNPNDDALRDYDDHSSVDLFQDLDPEGGREHDETNQSSPKQAARESHAQTSVLELLMRNRDFPKSASQRQSVAAEMINSLLGDNDINSSPLSAAVVIETLLQELMECQAEKEAYRVRLRRYEEV